MCARVLSFHTGVGTGAPSKNVLWRGSPELVELPPHSASGFRCVVKPMLGAYYET